ncbi:MAG: hypothetical protein K2J46_04975, partial [Muribaculaceae bacterium]|nr:hypothetical protein [Muribaculaceae bacterium]
MPKPQAEAWGKKKYSVASERRFIIQFFLFSLLMMLVGCVENPKDVRTVQQLPPIFPDYIDVAIPADIAPLNFSVSGAERVDVTVKGPDGGEVHANGQYADFNIKDWHRLTEANKGKSLTVSVIAKIDDKWIQYKDFSIHISSIPLDEWGLTYRRIAPGYEVYSKMGIYQRDLSNFDEYA